ncbi:MAG TPA: hypothetical protein VF607_13845 [Verrucomicrobiae bacterium]
MADTPNHPPAASAKPSLGDRLRALFGLQPAAPKTPKELLEAELIPLVRAGHKSPRSKYFRPSEAVFTRMEDYDVDRMVKDFAAKYPTLTESEVKDVVVQTIYFYYLR